MALKIKSTRIAPQATKFGAFGGVFTPSVLTILGVIVFLRYAHVVGYAGLGNALIILLAAKAISLITGLSLSSISTNMQVRGGGAYYLISRSLGIEFGGVIAVFFYIAQAVAVTLYVIGFSEAVFSAFPDLGLSFRLLATLTNLLVFASVYIGAGWTIRLQYGILAVLMLSLLSFMIGAADTASVAVLRANWSAGWSEKYTFFTVFALFFPAVTGIMAGVNMSGDLREPSRAIPRGTLAAIGFTAILYTAIAVLLAASSPRQVLVGDGFVMKDTARFSTLIYAGVISATLSSALGSMMGAPRILQAFARDNVFKWLSRLGRGSGPSNEPRSAIVLTFLIAQVGILAGDLDTVAPVITLFFLMTYGTVNLACFYEMISHNPSFRPAFRAHHWAAALAGAAGCLAVMLLINPLWSTVSIALAAALFLGITRAEIMVQWGDLHSGLAFQRARKALLRLEKEDYHPKNWRPSILTLSGGAWNRLHLVRYACQLSADRGVVSLAQIITGDLKDHFVRRREAEKLMRKFIREEQLPAFPVVVVDENFSEALKALLQCHGIGGLKPNTLLLGWSEEPTRSGVFPLILSLAKQMKKSLFVIRCRQEQEEWRVPLGAINVWWSDVQNGELMLLIAYLLRLNRQWRLNPLRILRPVVPKADVENIRKEMEKMLSLARIRAEIVILPTENPLDAVRNAMQPSAVLFAGFEPPDAGADITLDPALREIVDLPGDVILVYNAGDVSSEA
ncbi:amino acid permease [candidate division KSB1 bacterium]|nr:amino acid permease [candidate division KSB1 bacterium]